MLNEQLQQASRLIAANQRDQALKILQPLTREATNNAEVWWLIANCVTDTARTRQALARVLLIDPNHARAIKMMVTCAEPSITAVPPVHQSNSLLAAKLNTPVDPANSIMQIENVSKTVTMGKQVLSIIRDVSFNIGRAEMLAIVGPSGSGKSTLLSLMGGLDTPSAGKIVLDGTAINGLNEASLTRIRNEKIGFVFQFFNLIPTLSALDNVALPIHVAAKRQVSPTKRAQELLALLGLQDKMRNRPHELSGGQQQRVALARALANNPPLLLCDEPTGNLDSQASETVMNALVTAQKEFGTTIVLVTHSPQVALLSQRIIALRDGQITQDIASVFPA